MTTSLADLFDLTRAHARVLTPTAGVCADVASAMRHYANALHRCGTTEPGHPDRGHAENLAAACRDFATSTHRREQRLGQLAGATADTIAVLQPEMTTAHRWAVTVAITDTASELANLINSAPSLQHLAAARARHHLHHRIRDIHRRAAAYPPSAASSAILERPIPATFSVEPGSEQLMVHAAAGIVHHTRPGRSLALCEFLAVAIAMESLTETTARLAAPDTQSPDRRAATAWRAVQDHLRPFNDGSRRRQPDTPPLARYALDLHQALPRSNQAATAEQLVAIRDTLHHTPAISRNLIAAIQHWADTHTLLGYASDMPTGARHVTAYLAGHRPTGLIPADIPELQPTMTGIADAATATSELATTLNKTLHAPTTRGRIRQRSRHQASELLALHTELAAPSRPL